MGHPDGHDSPKRIEGQNSAPPGENLGLVNGRQLGWCAAIAFLYPWLTFVLGFINDSLAVSTAVVLPFVVALYSAAAFRKWPHRIAAFILSIAICWFLSEQLLLLLANSR